MDELHTRYRNASNPVARSHWQIIWLLAQGTPTAQVATAIGYTRGWIRTLARRYTAGGPDALGDRRHANPGGTPLLTPAQQAQLATLLNGPASDGGV
jgi:transposase